MHAALITGREVVELVEFPSPTPAASGVVVDIAFCGICGTDIHAFQSGRPVQPGDLRPRVERHGVGGRRRGAIAERGRPRRRGRRAVVRAVHRLPPRAGRPLRGGVPVRGRSRRDGSAARRIRSADRRRREPCRQDQPGADRRTGGAGRAVHRRVPRGAQQRAAARRHRRDPGRRPDRARRDAVGACRRCGSGHRGRAERRASCARAHPGRSRRCRPR